MEKRYGSPKRQDGIYKVGRNKYDLFYGFGKDNESDGTGWNWYKRFDHKPSLDEIKAEIIKQINADTDQRILSGFVWEGKPVWLSTENQFNYKAAYDMAVQTQGATLPVKFKFGTDNEATYHKFETLEELSDFYVKCLGYVQQVLAECWDEKEAIDWRVYSKS